MVKNYITIPRKEKHSKYVIMEQQIHDNRGDRLSGIQRENIIQNINDWFGENFSWKHKKTPFKLFVKIIPHLS